MTDHPPRAGEEILVGRLLGIARHARPKGPVETIDAVEVTVEEGVRGDYRGAFRPGGRNRRQVTVMAVERWHDALADLGAFVPWEERRVNLLVEGLELAHATGAVIRFAGGVALQVTGECDPCSRMETVAPGLRAALIRGWRGGIISRVIEGGRLSVGDEVRIER